MSEGGGGCVCEWGGGGGGGGVRGGDSAGKRVHLGDRTERRPGHLLWREQL